MTSARSAAAEARARATDRSSGLPGDVIEGYEILRELHRGGQGVVYQGTQKSTNRQVAIKVLKEGPFAGAGERARFEREVRILGALQDARIVTIHDSGSAAGSHYFVMDYIAGRPLDAYLAGRDLTVREIVALFAQIGEAVNTAHLLGIVHRDLKPGNILIDDAGAPHVLDFGLAKISRQWSVAGGQSAPLTTGQFTETGQFVGSLPWASPEQVRAGADGITPQSDVYSLGVLLYHALTRQFPYRVTGDVDEVLRNIREAVPYRPRLIRRQVDDEVETIVLKCLAKEPARRYETAGALARDLLHYLAHEPIEAKRDSTWYVLRKTLRRHRVALGVAGGFVALLAVSSAVSWTLFVRARDAAAVARIAEAIATKSESAARTQARRAQRINEFVTKALQSSNPHEGGRQEMLVADAMMQALQEIDAGAFDDDLETKAGMLGIIATILNRNGRSSEALGPSERALSIYRQLHAGHHRDVARSLNDLALVLQTLGRIADAEPLYQQALDMHRRLHDGDDADIASSLNNLASVWEALGRPADAEPLFQEALDMCRRLYTGDHMETAQCLNNLGYVRHLLGRPEEARVLFAESLDMRRRLFNGDHPEIAATLGNLASIAAVLEGPAAAEPLHVQALEMQRRLFKGDHGEIASTLNNLASVRKSLGRLDEAEALSAQALEMRRRLFPGDSVEVARSLNNLGVMRQALNRPTEAEPLFEQALQMQQRLFKGDHPEIARSLQNLAVVRLALDRPAEAEPPYRETLEMRRRLLKDDHPDLARSLNELAHVWQLLGRSAEAEPLRREALAMFQRLHGTDHPSVAHTMARLAQCLSDLGRRDEALDMAQDAVDLATRILPDQDPIRQRCEAVLGALENPAADASMNGKE